MEAEILTLSSKGQISIPIEVRRMLKLEMGDKLVMVTVGDSIVLKALKMPKLDEFEAAAEEARESAREAGLIEDDVSKTIREVRRRKKCG
ncbi:MAG: AbrB/MazE/SpoVT family DNA-binding domain-containing protein [Bacilli bacterium]|nr:AbrB/MazE/SpoVT family DNA-binding domain-containing protein [Bacilli bacterium]